MANKTIQRALLWALLLLAGLLAFAMIAVVALGIPRNASGMAAKGVCSAAFVAGRAWQNLLADDVLPASPALAPISIQVDTSAKTVTARFAGLFARTARLVPDRGCVLDLDPAPTPAATGTSRPPAPGLQPWPAGDAPLPPDQWGMGVDGNALQKLAQDTFTGAGDPQRANARAMAIVHKGRLLVLRTAPGFEPSTPLHGWSMTKTVAGMLGYKLAIDSGLAFDTPVVDAFAGKRGEPAWLGAWRGDTRRSIKVSDLFYMRDGLSNTEDYDPWGSVPRMLWGHADAPAFAAAAKPEAAPGARWRYLSQTANLLAAVDRYRLGSDAEYWAYPAKALFGPIGATTAVLESDTAGHWVASSYLWASVGDWARFGQLMLADGRWGTQQVLPPGWLAFAMAQSTAQGEGRGYGAHTWRIGDPDSGECKGYGLPADTIAMSGHWGQVLAMVPSREAVIVRMGWTFRRKQFDSCAFVAAALKALPH
jgi:CubicO group peptidase (beta-lactamase class C family)